jgi:hypothetical protein
MPEPMRRRLPGTRLEVPTLPKMSTMRKSPTIELPFEVAEVSTSASKSGGLLR